IDVPKLVFRMSINFVWLLQISERPSLSHLFDFTVSLFYSYLMYSYASYELTLLSLMAYDQNMPGSLQSSLLQPVYLASTLPLCTNWTGSPKLMTVGMFVSTSTVCLPLAFVLYTYTYIFLGCRKRSSNFQCKVIQSCLPHFITFVNYSITVFCDVALRRNDLENVNPFLAVILSLEKYILLTLCVNRIYRMLTFLQTLL
uniref:Uncharacterized protein n=1 Tax=Mola mola TaxID=94237 RepID=A0A3Q3VVP9_MOLML